VGGRSSLVNGDTLGGILEGGARKAVFKGLEGGGAGVADEGADLGGETCGSRVGGGDNLEVDDDAAGGHTENRNLVRVDLKCTKDRVLSHLKDLSAGGEPTISETDHRVAFWFIWVRRFFGVCSRLPLEL